MGFYGNITNVSRTQFQFDKIYPNRKAMEQNIISDGIYLGRYVLVEYDDDGLDGMKEVAIEGNVFYFGAISDASKLTWGNTVENEVVYNIKTEVFDNIETKKYTFYKRNSRPSGANNNDPATFTKFTDDGEDTYTRNHAIDAEIYQSSRGYDSTVWQKVFSDKVEKYVMIAELNTVVPKFDIATDAPTMIPVAPHFDTQSTDVYYKLHMQNPWVVRVAEAKENEPSDSTTKWINVIYDEKAKEGYRYSVEEVEKNAAIYFNKAGFKEDIPSKVSGENKITMSLASSGQTIYDDHDNTTSDPITALDIQELTINLPGIGNMMSDAWDIIHGPNRNDDMREIDPETGDYVASLKGRLDSIDAIADDEIPVKRHDNGQLIGSKINGGKADEDDKTGINDDAWIETVVDAATNTISIHHKFNRTKNGNTFIDLRAADDWGHDTTDSIDMNNEEDNFDIVTPIIDDMGHIVGENTQTVTLPYGFKTIKTNGRSNEVTENATGTPVTADIVADNTKGELTINSGNKWIRIDADASNDSLTIRHDVHKTSSDEHITDWTQTEADTIIPVVAYSHDKAGHYVSHHTENYKLPFGYGKINGDSGSTAATATYDELTFASDEWLTATVTKDTVTYNHDYPKKIDDTVSESNINGNGDTIVLETLERDDKGHVIKINQNTVTLPFSYKIFEDSQPTPGQSIANSTQDTMVLKGDNWIKPIVSNNLITMEHIGPADVMPVKADDVTPQFGEKFTITDWYFDNKGHKSRKNTHFVQIPLPSLTNGSGNVVTGLSLIPSAGAFEETKNNISNLVLTDYSKKTDNNDIAATDALGDALSKLQTQIHDTETKIDAVKNELLGDGITETFDTLVEIQNWINGDGVNATELTTAIAAETNAREAAFNTLGTAAYTNSDQYADANILVDARFAFAPSNSEDPNFTTLSISELFTLVADLQAQVNSLTNELNSLKNNNIIE